MPDPVTSIHDLSVHLSDDEVRAQAAELEAALAVGGSSKALAAIWIALLGTLAGVLGAAMLSPAVRSSTLLFIAYVAAAPVLLGFMHPLTKRVFGDAIALAAALAMFWAFLLGATAVLGARLDSPFWGYVASGVIGGFFGLMAGSLNPSLVTREEIYLTVALPLAPLTALAGTYVARTMSPMTDLPAAAAAGVIAGGVFSCGTAAALAALWSQANSMTRLGVLYLHNENFTPRAVTYLTRAIELRPDSAELYNLRGIAYSKMKDDARAAVDLEKAASLAPKDAEPAMNRGVGYLEREEYDQAIAAFQLALRINPKTPKLQSNLGIAYERSGDLDLAIAHYDEAIRQSPKHANAYSNRGYAHHRKGEHQRALDDCDHALKLRPDLVPAMVNRGHALRGLGRIDDAIACYEEALHMGGDATFHDEARRALEDLTGPAVDAEVESLRLVTPSAQWRAAFEEMARESASTGDGRYALAVTDFEAYLRNIDEGRRSENLPPGWVPATEFWLEDDGRIVACARLRFALTPDLEHEGGHIGYDVRPSMRRRGYGAAVLRLALVEARAAGIQRVRLTCDDDNIGSIKVVERNGGVFAGVGVSKKTGKPVRQYWIE